MKQTKHGYKVYIRSHPYQKLALPQLPQLPEVFLIKGSTSFKLHRFTAILLKHQNIRVTPVGPGPPVHTPFHNPVCQQK